MAIHEGAKVATKLAKEIQKYLAPETVSRLVDFLRYGSEKQIDKLIVELSPRDTTAQT